MSLEVYGMEAISAGIGAAAAVNLTTGVPMMDVATSMSGGAGAGLGYVLGQYVSYNVTSGAYDTGMFLPFAGAIAVPALSSGIGLDQTTITLGIGAVAGAYVGGYLLARSMKLPPSKGSGSGSGNY